MPTTDKTLRVLIVDDNRDGADTLGLLVEELGNEVHVTYSIDQTNQSRFRHRQGR